MESCAFHLYPTTDVLTFSTSTSSSSLLDYGQSVISSTKTSSFSWDCRGPIFSSGFLKVFGLGLETPFLAPEFCPISPCYTVEVSSSTHFRLMDYGPKVVTSSSQTTFSSSSILSLHLWPWEVIKTSFPGMPTFAGVIVSQIHTLSFSCVNC
jgi:hypothetical protein